MLHKILKGVKKYNLLIAEEIWDFFQLETVTSLKLKKKKKSV
jgi:hypothetical protein